MLFDIYHSNTMFLDVIAWKYHVLGIYCGNTMVLGHIMWFYHVIWMQHHGKPCFFSCTVLIQCYLDNCYLAFIMEMSCCFRVYCGSTMLFGCFTMVKLCYLAFTIIIPSYECDNMKRPCFEALTIAIRLYLDIYCSNTVM